MPPGSIIFTLTLSEIKHLLDEWGENTIPKQEQVQIIERKLEEISEKMHNLENIKTYLSSKLRRLQEEVS